MNRKLLVEEKYNLLKEMLSESLRKKRALEFNINEQFESLKKLEISMERYAWSTVAEKRKTSLRQ